MSSEIYCSERGCFFTINLSVVFSSGSIIAQVLAQTPILVLGELFEFLDQFALVILSHEDWKFRDWIDV